MHIMNTMKTLIITIVLTINFQLLTFNSLAQAPEKMSYQAVIRNSSNALIVSTAVGIKISILQGTSSGTAVFVETHTASTNANGLVSLEIGTGTVIAGTFATINWAAGPYFIKTETDPTGGTSYSITGTSQVLSVPYALHAKTADSVVGGLNWNVYMGYVWLDGSIAVSSNSGSNTFSVSKTAVGQYHIYLSGCSATNYAFGNANIFVSGGNSTGNDWISLSGAGAGTIVFETGSAGSATNIDKPFMFTAFCPR